MERHGRKGRRRRLAQIVQRYADHICAPSRVPNIRSIEVPEFHSIFPVRIGQRYFAVPRHGFDHDAADFGAVGILEKQIYLAVARRGKREMGRPIDLPINKKRGWIAGKGANNGASVRSRQRMEISGFRFVPAGGPRPSLRSRQAKIGVCWSESRFVRPFHWTKPKQYKTSAAEK